MLVAEPLAPAADRRQGDAGAGVWSPSRRAPPSSNQPEGGSNLGLVVGALTVFGRGQEAAPRKCNFRSRRDARRGGREPLPSRAPRHYSPAEQVGGTPLLLFSTTEVEGALPPPLPAEADPPRLPNSLKSWAGRGLPRCVRPDALLGS